ncbi:rhomboid family intramembrane serine protease [Alteromonas sp. C1M14]|uniref:rhomboid family intramembrane serine protease n=1 Tax=Alteromonas sp. C1M14 TaxID=2841567 RepID=UPI001C09E205|nr:rhomboid family intramembrane serine protease [Alteromonas sp. C1M14]MBU2978447.1 rhomboid family intramembrane serine protease [Alteromonas sp. C1M14]
MHGEVWRLITGPLLHSSILHFLSNTLFLLLIGPLTWYFYSYRTVGVILLANTLGALVSTLLGTYTDNTPFDGYAGLSPGIFALYGLVSLSGVLNKRLLPPGIALHLGFIAIISIVTASVYINHTANWSHWAGLLFGMALAPLLKGKKIELSEVTELNLEDYFEGMIRGKKN